MLGVNFLGFLMFFANVSIFYLLSTMCGEETENLYLLHPVISIAVIAIVLGYGSFRINEIENFLEGQNPGWKSRMVQANFDYAEKNLDNEPVITEKHREMSREFAEVDLVIWPETSVQHWFPKEDSVYRIDYQTDVVPAGHAAHFLIGGLSFIQDPALLEDGWGRRR